MSLHAIEVMWLGPTGADLLVGQSYNVAPAAATSSCLRPSQLA
ncbi:hypothetical protein [Micromonospora avicenniae]|nr:hypothetical protein [Micromonospora avicenniae]